MTEIIIKVDDRFLEEAKIKGMEEQFELIRCKDCKWFDKWLTTGGECNGFGDGGYCPEDGFCHNAERKKK